MAVRFLLVVAVAISAVSGQFMSEPGPEEMHFPVVRALNKATKMQLGSLQTYMLLRATHAKILINKPDMQNKVEKVIEMKYKSFLSMVNFSAERGLTPDVDTPETAELSNCDKQYSCWKVVLKMERDIYKAFASLYSTAANHEDAATQAMIVPLIQQQLKIIRYDRRYIAAIDKILMEKGQPEERFNQRETSSDDAGTGTDDTF